MEVRAIRINQSGGLASSGAGLRQDLCNELGEAAITALIQPVPLLQECIVTALRTQQPDARFAVFSSPHDWDSSSVVDATALIVLWLQTDAATDWEVVLQQVNFIRERAPGAGIVVASDQIGVAQAVRMLQCGVSVVMPADTGLRSLVSIFEFVRSGGVYIPPSLVEQAGKSRPATAATPEAVSSFSPRQLAVARALSRGAPNKTIAYELNMCESTVKVHVRAIMKKLKVHNRTQVACAMHDNI